MICPVCNKKNKNGVSVCIHCGAKLFTEALTQEESRSTVGKYKMSVSKKFLIGALSGAAVLIVVLIVLLLKPSRTETRPSGEIIYSENRSNRPPEQSAGAPSTQEPVQEQNTAPIAAANSGQSGNTAEVMDYRLRMRSEPNTRARIVEHLPKGAQVSILEKSKLTTLRLGGKNVSGYWYKVRWEKPSDTGNPTQVTGWVWGKFLRFNTSNG